MICISFQIHNLAILMYHSVVKVIKNCGLEFFRIKPQSSICLYASTKCSDICLQKSSDMLNKNTWGVKEVRGQSEAACKQAGATKSFDKKLLTPSMTYNSL